MTGPVCRGPEPDEIVLTILSDGFTVLYHRPSGQTHMLTEPAPEILAALEQGEADAAELVRRLGRDHGLDSEGDAEAVVSARLAELAELGLVRTS
ncbi:MAG: HPr-rel-A system PqqD family peptide chaperone [Sphingomonadaceae bacterium]